MYKHILNYNLKGIPFKIQKKTVSIDGKGTLKKKKVLIPSKSKSDIIKSVNKSAQILHVPITFIAVLDRLINGSKNDKPNFDVSAAVTEVINFHDALIRNHSVVEGTARYNKIRLYCINLLEGQNPEPLERVAVGKKDR